jgi:hypothetical protein
MCETCESIIIRKKGVGYTFDQIEFDIRNYWMDEYKVEALKCLNKLKEISLERGITIKIL